MQWVRVLGTKGSKPMSMTNKTCLPSLRNECHVHACMYQNLNTFCKYDNNTKCLVHLYEHILTAHWLPIFAMTCTWPYSEEVSNPVKVQLQLLGQHMLHRRSD